MAMASGGFGPFIRDSMNNVKAIDLDGDTHKWQIVSDAHTPDFDLHDEESDITNEVTGTGYTTGGEVLGSSTFTIASSVATFDGADVSLSNTTLSGIEGDIFFDDTIAGDPLLVAHDYGQTYNTSAGTFAITWNASGIFTITYA